jgi:hypothetical protein
MKRLSVTFHHVCADSIHASDDVTIVKAIEPIL